MANEKRLIDLDATLQRLEKESWWLDSVKSCIRMFLAKAKLVDAVEVVRCKDCKHCIYISYACGDVRCGKLHTDYIKENDFCSYGERKDNE